MGSQSNFLNQSAFWNSSTPFDDASQSTFFVVSSPGSSSSLSSSSSPIVDLSTSSPPTMNDFSVISLHFTSTNKMSLFSLERRIDYHLSRIMKGHRLINFKNSIERLSTEKRICESILEVLVIKI